MSLSALTGLLVLGIALADKPSSGYGAPAIPQVKYGGPIVYSAEKPPIIHFPPPPAEVSIPKLSILYLITPCIIFLFCFLLTISKLYSRNLPVTLRVVVEAAVRVESHLQWNTCHFHITSSLYWYTNLIVGHQFMWFIHQDQLPHQLLSMLLSRHTKSPKR